MIPNESWISLYQKWISLKIQMRAHHLSDIKQMSIEVLRFWFQSLFFGNRHMLLPHCLKYLQADARSQTLTRHFLYVRVSTNQDNHLPFFSAWSCPCLLTVIFSLKKWWEIHRSEGVTLSRKHDQRKREFRGWWKKVISRLIRCWLVGWLGGWGSFNISAINILTLWSVLIGPGFLCFRLWARHGNSYAEAWLISMSSTESFNYATWRTFGTTKDAMLWWLLVHPLVVVVVHQAQQLGN